MRTDELAPTLTLLFHELTRGPQTRGGAFILNSGDAGLLASLEKLSADDASQSVHGGATIAAHAEHLRYGLSLMNRWAEEGGNPFADARWEDAWKISKVDDAQWREIHRGLAREVDRWQQNLGAPRNVESIELAGMIGSVAHLAYHLGAMRQIAKAARGPREGSF